ncbi:MAG: hypothetical protein FWE27_04920 [Defluviitaleaceae bacterium]|nr:hypothetical protein [Defluviitaleaceae bacterium]
MVISIVIISFGVIYVITASQVHYTGTHAEREINEIIQGFMDRIADAGFVIPDDYNRLTQSLGVSGGTFSLTFTVERLLPVPDTYYSTPQSGVEWVRRYHLVHSFNTQDGSFAQMTGPLNLQRHDKITLNVEQLTAMSHEVLDTRAFSSETHLRNWNFQRGVRNTGNAFQTQEVPDEDLLTTPTPGP